MAVSEASSPNNQGAVSTLFARGYRIVTIPQLLGFHPTYVPCIELCAGIGIPRAQLPAGGVVERAP